MFQLDYSMMIKTSNKLNGKKTYKYDDAVEEEDDNNQTMYKSVNEIDYEKSIFDEKFETLGTEKVKFQIKYEYNKLLKQPKQEEKRHYEVVASKQIQLNAMNNNVKKLSN